MLRSTIVVALTAALVMCQAVAEATDHHPTTPRAMARPASPAAASRRLLDLEAERVQILSRTITPRGRERSLRRLCRLTAQRARLMRLIAARTPDAHAVAARVRRTPRGIGRESGSACRVDGVVIERGGVSCATARRIFRAWTTRSPKSTINRTEGAR